MGKDIKKYTSLDSEKCVDAVETYVGLVERFIKENQKMDYREKILINQDIIYQMVHKVNQRKQYFEFFHEIDMSDLKEMALYCFWTVKLKPIYYCADDKDTLVLNNINEKFVVYYIIKELKILANGNKSILEKIENLFDEQYIYEMVYSLTYRDFSKEALIFLVETIGKAVGFEVYKK